MLAFNFTLQVSEKNLIMTTLVKVYGSSTQF